MALWEDLNMPGFEAPRRKTQTVIFPVGSLEEHGPHLPLGTDTFHALEVARRVARAAPVRGGAAALLRRVPLHPGAPGHGEPLRGHPPGLGPGPGPGVLPPGVFVTW